MNTTEKIGVTLWQFYSQKVCFQTMAKLKESWCMQMYLFSAQNKETQNDKTATINSPVGWWWMINYLFAELDRIAFIWVRPSQW